MQGLQCPIKEMVVYAYVSKAVSGALLLGARGEGHWLVGWVRWLEWPAEKNHHHAALAKQILFWPGPPRQPAGRPASKLTG